MSPICKPKVQYVVVQERSTEDVPSSDAFFRRTPAPCVSEEGTLPSQSRLVLQSWRYIVDTRPRVVVIEIARGFAFKRNSLHATTCC